MNMTLDEIKHAVTNLKTGESVEVITDLTPRKLKNRLVNIADDEGNCMLYQCKSIPGGVRVTCGARFKITNVHVVERDESDAI
jgi:hypothetical protein